MSATVILGLLAKEVGFPIAKKILSSLQTGSSANEKFQKVINATSAGKSVVDTLRNVFGEEFDAAISNAIGAGKNGWTYEAGRGEYIKFEMVGDRGQIISSLRNELNLNLDRIVSISNRDNKTMSNYFHGMFAEWMERYSEFIGVDEDAEKTFDGISKFLDGRARTFKDAYKIIAKTGLNGAGALLILNAVMMSTGIGLGALGQILLWLNGVPVVQVGALGITGVLLIRLSRKVFDESQTRSACVQMAYKLLDRRNAEIKFSVCGD